MHISTLGQMGYKAVKPQCLENKMRRNRVRLIPSKMEGLLIQKSSDFKGLAILIFDGVVLLQESMLESWGSIETDSSLKTIFCFVLLSFLTLITVICFLWSCTWDYPKKFSVKSQKLEDNGGYSPWRFSYSYLFQLAKWGKNNSIALQNPIKIWSFQHSFGTDNSRHVCQSVLIRVLSLLSFALVYCITASL